MLLPHGIGSFSAQNRNIDINPDRQIGKEIYNDSKTNASVLNIMKNFTSRNVPLLSMQWSIGLTFWIILIFTCISYLRNGCSSLIIYLPVWGIWLTLMIAAPVWAEYRYVFSAYTCLPVLMCYPYICNIKSNK